MKPQYILNTNEVASASSKIMFDLYNATGSGHKVKVNSLEIVVKTDVAVTGTLSPRYDIVRTSAIGTSGTSVGNNASATTTASLISTDSSVSDLPTTITARVAPAAGATTLHWLGSAYPFSEETNAATYWVRNYLSAPIILAPGQGFSAKQGSVASVNSYIFIVTFEIEETE